MKIESEVAIAKAASSISEISQAYLFGAKGCTFRVRSATNKKGKIEYFFTFKVNTGGRIVEVEDYLDDRDFKDLWAISFNKLEKTRYKFNGEYKGWVADFFRDHNDLTYFAMAECEMPEGDKSPKYVPAEIKESLVYEVPLTDDRFCSKLLSDVRYARNLFNEIG